jgi:hypothetical protein
MLNRSNGNVQLFKSLASKNTKAGQVETYDVRAALTNLASGETGGVFSHVSNE